MLKDVLLLTYTVFTLFLTLYSVAQAALTLRLVATSFRKHKPSPPSAPSVWPLVVLQLPLYNEKYVVARLLEAVAALDYPRDRLIVQVLDDSTDDTVEVVAGLVAQHQRGGLNIQHVRRPERTGFKAGAMAYGLTLVPEAEFAAILDADFVPAPDFISRLVPYFYSAPRVAFVQGRWDHLNGLDNWLTRAQALNIDAYYAIEQEARSAIGTVMSFNGTGGMWRIEAIHAAGGWLADTLTEDFDLSYRAQLLGWRGMFASDVVVPGELPPQIEAYKRQQSRWATGSNQVFLKLVRPLLTSSMPWQRKALALLHLTQYLPHPIMLVLLLLAPWMILSGAHKQLVLAPLTVFAVIQPTLHLMAQRRLHPEDWGWRMLAFPVVMILGIGMLWNNTRAAYAAYQSWRQHRELEFVRTPKFGVQVKSWTHRAYALNPISGQTWIELGLAVYASVAYFLALQTSLQSALWLMTYAIALGGVGLWSMSDQWRMSRPLAQPSAPVELSAGD